MMSDMHFDLANELEKSLGLRKGDFANYLFRRAQVLIEESGDDVAIGILADIRMGRTPNDPIDKYAEDCEYATSDEPRFYCNYVFLLFLILQMYKTNATDSVFRHLCDEYSSLVESVGDDDGYEIDLNEIRAHFETHLDENSTFRARIHAAVATRRPR